MWPLRDRARDALIEALQLALQPATFSVLPEGEEQRLPRS